MYLDYKQDESYTPQRLSLRAGTCYQDIQVGRAGKAYEIQFSYLAPGNSSI